MVSDICVGMEIASTVEQTLGSVIFREVGVTVEEFAGDFPTDEKEARVDMVTMSERI